MGEGGDEVSEGCTLVLMTFYKNRGARRGCVYMVVSMEMVATAVVIQGRVRVANSLAALTL